MSQAETCGEQSPWEKEPFRHGKSVFYEFQSSRVAPSDAGRAWRDTTEIAFQGKTRLGFDEKWLFRTRGTADQAHIITFACDNQCMLGSTRGIHKRSSNGGEICCPLMIDPDSSPPWIGHSCHVIERASNFTVSAACALGMVDLNLRHPYTPIKSRKRFYKTRLRRSKLAFARVQPPVLQLATVGWHFICHRIRLGTRPHPHRFWVILRCTHLFAQSSKAFKVSE